MSLTEHELICALGIRQPPQPDSREKARAGPDEGVHRPRVTTALHLIFAPASAWSEWLTGAASAIELERFLRRWLALLSGPGVVVCRTGSRDLYPLTMGVPLMVNYQSPAIIDNGTVESLTAGATTGDALDQTFPVGTPFSALTFS